MDGRVCGIIDRSALSIDIQCTEVGTRPASPAPQIDIAWNEWCERTSLYILAYTKEISACWRTVTELQFGRGIGLRKANWPSARSEAIQRSEDMCDKLTRASVQGRLTGGPGPASHTTKRCRRRMRACSTIRRDTGLQMSLQTNDCTRQELD